MKTIYIIATALPGLTPWLDMHAGRYIQSYEPKPWRDPLYGLRTTPSYDEAMKFTDTEAAMAFWTQTDPLAPERYDGKPNRPLTLFTVTIE